MKYSLKGIAAAGVLALLMGAPALAGEQFVDASGYAVSGYDVVAYFDQEQSPVGKAQPPATPGKAAITAEYNGAKFAFASEANRERFIADPARYAPQFDGHCAYGVVKDGKVPGNPNLWRIVDDRLYLNITRNVVGFWEEDIPGNIDVAARKWPGMEGNAASDRAIPDFDSKGAPSTN